MVRGGASTTLEKTAFGAAQRGLRDRTDPLVYTQGMATRENAANARPPFGPPARYQDELRAALDEAERGEFLDEATSAAYVRWLETVEGPCPWPVESSS